MFYVLYVPRFTGNLVWYIIFSFSNCVLCSQGLHLLFRVMDATIQRMLFRYSISPLNVNMSLSLFWFLSIIVRSFITFFCVFGMNFSTVEKIFFIHFILMIFLYSKYICMSHLLNINKIYNVKMCFWHVLHLCQNTQKNSYTTKWRKYISCLVPLHSIMLAFSYSLN